MQTVSQTQPAAQQGFSAVAYAKRILARDEGSSDEVSALEATFYRELLMAAGIPTEPGMEMLTLLLAYGGGESQLSVSDRELVDHVLPAGGKDIDSKMQHIRYTRKKVRDAIEAGAHPVIGINPGHGSFNARGGREGIPTAYKLPILKLRRECLRQLPDDPPPGAIRAAAQSVIRAAYGGVRRKNDSGRKLRDVSARTSARTGVAHLKKAAQDINAAQVIAEALEEAPALRLVLPKALGQPPAPQPAAQPGMSPFEALEADFDPFIEWVGEEVDDPERIAIAVRIGREIEAFRQATDRQKKASDEIPQVQSLQHGAEVVNFNTSGAKTAPKTDPEQPPEPDSQAPPSDPVPRGVECDDSPPPAVGLEVESQEMSPAEIADLSPPSQAAETLALFQAAGFDHIFLRLEDADRETLHHRTIPILEALDVLPKALANADSRRASLMFRPMNGDRPQTKMTPEEIAVDDATIRPRAIQLDDIGQDTFEMVLPLAAFGFSSSPGNYQAVVFVRADKETAGGLWRRFVKGVGADPGASGSYRLPGSSNWKPERAGAKVQLHHIAYGRVLTPEQLESSGLLVPPPDPSPAPRATVTRYARPLRAPSYQISIDRARRKKDGVTPDYSSGDQSYANTCQNWGFTWDETAGLLTDCRNTIDDKARRNPGYITRTVNNAFR